jgi:hypothetical protein
MEKNRWDCPGIFMIGDRVVWDGEGEYLDVPLQTTKAVDPALLTGDDVAPEVDEPEEPPQE